MLHDITTGRYIKSDSVWHRIDPRMKIIMSLFFSATVFICNNIFSIFSAMFLAGIAISIAEIPIRFILKGLKSLSWFLLFMFFINIFSGTGNILFKWGIITITEDGIYKALLVTSKFVVFNINTSMLTLTTSPISLTDGFAWLVKPLKKFHVPTDSLAMIVTVMLRLIPTVADEYERISKASRARRFGAADKGIIAKIKVVAVCVIPLLINSFRHTDELALAMDARCYGSGMRKPRKKLKFARNDVIFSSVVIFFCIFLAFIEFLH